MYVCVKYFVGIKVFSFSLHIGEASKMTNIERETLLDAVTDYYFCDGGDEPVLFSKLPVKWDENECSSPDAKPIFLRCTADNGLQLYKLVKAWKYDLSKESLEISVHYKDDHWFKLQKPRKSYENEMRTILITLLCLYLFKCEPEASGQALWDHLSQVFRYLNLSVQLVFFFLSIFVSIC